MNAPWSHEWGRSPAEDRVWSQVCGLRPSDAAERLFMVLQAYFDDSLDKSGTFVVAGYVASAEEWAAFSREWEAMLPYSSVQDDGRYRFKMSEMALSEERMGRVAAFHKIINDHVRFSISVIMNVHDIERARARILLDGAGVEWLDSGSHFHLAYRAIMDNFTLFRAQSGGRLPEGETIDVYFDETSEKGEILRGWEEYVADAPKRNAPEVFTSMPRFENDERFLPIQAADFRAWWVRKWATELTPQQLGTEASYPFPTAAKQIRHVVAWITEDQFVENMCLAVQGQHPTSVVRDRLIYARNDPPSPFERGVAKLRSFVAGALGRTRP